MNNIKYFVRVASHRLLESVYATLGAAITPTGTTRIAGLKPGVNSGSPLEEAKSCMVALLLDAFGNGKVNAANGIPDMTCQQADFSQCAADKVAAFVATL